MGVAAFVPNADGAMNGFSPSTGTARWSLIDEDPASIDSGFLTTTNVGTGEFYLSATPEDLDYVGTDADQILLEMTFSVSGRVDDGYSFEARIQDSTGTAMTDTVQLLVNANQSTTRRVFAMPLNAHGLANNNKSTWDGARLYLFTTKSQNMGSDTITTILEAFEINYSYVEVVPPFTPRPTRRQERPVRHRGAAINSHHW